MDIDKRKFWNEYKSSLAIEGFFIAIFFLDFLKLSDKT